MTGPRGGGPLDPGCNGYPVHGFHGFDTSIAKRGIGNQMHRSLASGVTIRALLQMRLEVPGSLSHVVYYCRVRGSRELGEKTFFVFWGVSPFLVPRQGFPFGSVSSVGQSARNPSQICHAR
jgi:hypothetical protein